MARFASLNNIYLPASLLDEQNYCELRLDFKISEGKASPLKPGEARQVVRQTLFKVIDHKFSGVSGFKRVSVAGEIFGVPVAASPDAALMENGVVTALLRGRIRNPPRVYDSDYTRLLAAAYVMDSSGKLAEDAKLAVVVGVNPESLKRLVEIIAEEGVKPLKNAFGLVSVRIYDRSEAAEILNDLMAYWRGERAPRPNPSSRKCATCNYALQCRYAATSNRLG